MAPRHVTSAKKYRPTFLDRWRYWCGGHFYRYLHFYLYRYLYRLFYDQQVLWSKQGLNRSQAIGRPGLCDLEYHRMGI